MMVQHTITDFALNSMYLRGETCSCWSPK